MQKWKTVQLVGGQTKAVSANSGQPKKSTNKEKTVGSSIIGFDDLLAILATIFGGSSEPDPS
jgi:hypothetical protein